MRAAIVLMFAIALTGCSSLTAKNPIAEAKALNARAEQCLLDVRDKKMKYDTSPNCKALGASSKTYIDAGGQLPDEPVETKLVAEQAVKMAWNAQAVSATSNPTISLW
jgi:uncharacterized protein YceK